MNRVSTDGLFVTFFFQIGILIQISPLSGKSESSGEPIENLISKIYVFGINAELQFRL